jgi:hypothetical protein
LARPKNADGIRGAKNPGTPNAVAAATLTVESRPERANRRRRNERGNRGNAVPEFAQPFDPTFRRIPGYQGRVHGADRDPGNPIWNDTRLGEALIRPRLIGA